MARVTTVTVSDDLDGGPADETVAFCLDGRPYEIDLSTDNARRLRAVLTRYVTRARPRSTGAVTPGNDRPPETSGVASTARMRAWARRHGHQVSRVGRLPLEVEQAYHQARYACSAGCADCAADLPAADLAATVRAAATVTPCEMTGTGHVLAWTT